jgi:hypothetical protein
LFFIPLVFSRQVLKCRVSASVPSFHRFQVESTVNSGSCWIQSRMSFHAVAIPTDWLLDAHACPSDSKRTGSPEIRDIDDKISRIRSSSRVCGVSLSASPKSGCSAGNSDYHDMRRSGQSRNCNPRQQPLVGGLEPLLPRCKGSLELGFHALGLKANESELRGCSLERSRSESLAVRR